MLHVEASILIQAPPVRTAGISRDYNRWPSIFPTISAVRLVCEGSDKAVVVVDHWEGKVVNILTTVSPTEVHLEEFKKRYNAQFLNRFEAAPEGTRYTVLAEISLKGMTKYLEPFLGDYVRRKIVRFVLEPIKQAAEGISKEDSGI